jgi:Domain of unknown function (DUF4386)
LNEQTAGIALVFFGVGAIINGVLIARSGFLPRALGIVSVVGGFGWLTFLWPPLGLRVFPVVALVGLAGGLATSLWLLVKGVRAVPRGAAVVALVLCALGACAPADSAPASSTTAGAPPAVAIAAVDSGFASVPDSAWVSLTGPTIVAFHPVVSNDSLARDEGLAAAMDDLAYHLGSAMDSLTALGVAVQYRGGDTLWLRHGPWRLRFIRAADSATVGYIFADTAGRWTARYGVRNDIDLERDAHLFARTGTLPPD